MKKKVYFIIIFSLLISLLILIILGCSLKYKEYNKSSFCLPSITLSHFSTDTLTGKCDFFPGSGCLIEDPEDYIIGCNISIKEKAEILKNKRYWNENISWFDKLTTNCTKYCNEDYDQFFCYSENNSKNLCEEIEAYG